MANEVKQIEQLRAVRPIVKKKRERSASGQARQKKEEQKKDSQGDERRIDEYV